MPHQRLNVVEQRGRNIDALDLGLSCHEVARARRRQRLQHVAAGLAGEQRALGGAVGITEADAHQEAIELRLGQRKGPDLRQRVLRGDHEKWRRQRPRQPIDRNLLSSIASSSADCVFGLARLISSANSTSVKIGPGWNANWPLVRS